MCESQIITGNSSGRVDFSKWTLNGPSTLVIASLVVIIVIVIVIIIIIIIIIVIIVFAVVK